MSAHHGIGEAARLDSRDRKKRSSFIPTSTSSVITSASGQRYPNKKLSKAQPAIKSAARGNSMASPPVIATDARRHALSSGHPLVPPATMGTPSLVSGSSAASTFESPRSNVLRRKPSTIAKFVAARSEASTLHYENTGDDSVLGIAMPTIRASSSLAFIDRTTPVGGKTHWNTSQPLSLSSLGITSADTPSTRFTGSPFSHIEAPSSRSSVSPLGYTVSSPYNHKDLHKATKQQVTGVQYRSSQNKHDEGEVRQFSNDSTKPSNIQSKQQSMFSGPPDQLLASPELGVRPANRISYASSSSQIVQAPPQIKSEIPPELAHLIDNSRLQNSYASPTQMSRFHQSQLPQRNSSLIDSHLDVTSPPTQQHSRTGSRGSITSSSGHSIRDRLGLTSRNLSKLSLYSSNESSQPSSEIRDPALRNVGKSKMRIAQSSSEVDSAKPAAKLTQKTSRFGFLTKKSKPEVAETTEMPKREPRRGPAAGTGHERYGRFGVRGRSGSTVSPTDSRSPSTGSQKSGFSDRFRRRKDSTGTQETEDMDEFLRERLKPKIIRGSGSNFSAGTSPSIYSTCDDREGSVFEDLARVSTSRSQALETTSITSNALASPLAVSGVPNIHNLLRNPTPHPKRESVQSVSSNLSLHEPAIVFDSEKKSSVLSMKHQDAEEGLWLRPMEPIKKPNSRWNFLQRVRSSPLRPKSSRSMATNEQSPENKKFPFDNAAHYALLDAVEPVTLAEVEELVASPTTANGIGSEKLPAQSSATPPLHDTRRDTLLPTPPHFGTRLVRELSPVACAISPASGRSVSPLDEAVAAISPPESVRINDAYPSSSSGSRPGWREYIPSPVKEERIVQSAVQTPDLSAPTGSPRLPRLSPVGRIPRVKSGRDRDRQLPNTSFSRPFANVQPRQVARPPGTLYSQIRDAASPTLDMQDSVSTTLARVERLPKYEKTNHGTSSGPLATTTSVTYPGFSMFSFPSRKNSDFSYSSSSETTSYMAFAYEPAFEQDDVWHEYNDLLDEVSVDNPFKRRSHRSSMACSAQSQFTQNAAPVFKDRAVLGSRSPASPPPDQALPPIPRNQSFKTVSSIAASLSESAGAKDGQVRYVVSPEPMMQQQQNSIDSKDSSRDSQVSALSRTLSYPDGNIRSSHTSFSSGADFVRRSRISMISLNDGRMSGIHPAVNTNFEALMTSKWLSFGRVLFSPAHNETRLSDDPRILILDGLSDEWSYFVALTYPQATVYNLELTSRQGTRKSQSQSLPNHCKIYHAGVGAPLPFPKGFFTAAVFRFPVATTDQAYHTAIAEFKRVLRPGGHLEISMLDIDLRGMGNVARKAVRGLKTRMQQSQESISLRSLSDFMVQSVGKRGFDQIQRCIVGVPVISRALKNDESRSLPMLLGAIDSTSLSAIKGRNDLLEKQGEAGVSNTTHDVDESDDKMTRNVARVGRWWYSMCYERVVPKTDQSIWKDEALLQECYENGTSFQLLMCHAQKPVQVRRHTRSV